MSTESPKEIDNLDFSTIQAFTCSKEPTFVGAVVTLVVIGNLGVILRAIGQWRISRRFFLDDYFLWFAVSATDAVCAIWLDATRINKRITLDSTPETLQQQLIHWTKSLLRLNFASVVLNQPILGAVRISLLIMYRRLFIVNQKWIKNFWLGIFIYNIAWVIGSTFYNVFYCRPPSWYWDRVDAVRQPDGSYAGTCDIHRLTTIPLMLSLPCDIAVLLLPVIVVSKMNINRKRKIGLTILFSLGITACACELGRIVIEYKLKTAQSALDSLSTFAILTVAEDHLAIFCACLPLCATLYQMLCKVIRDKLHPIPLINSMKKTSGDEESESSGMSLKLHNMDYLNPSGFSRSKVESQVSRTNSAVLASPDLDLREEILVTTNIVTQTIDRFDKPLEGDEKI